MVWDKDVFVGERGGMVSLLTRFCSHSMIMMISFHVSIGINGIGIIGLGSIGTRSIGIGMFGIIGIICIIGSNGIIGIGIISIGIIGIGIIGSAALALSL